MKVWLTDDLCARVFLWSRTKRKPHREGGVENSKVQFSDAEFRAALPDVPLGASLLDGVRAGWNRRVAAWPIRNRLANVEHSTPAEVHSPDAAHSAHAQNSAGAVNFRSVKNS